jgi:Ca2+-binding EF-hand superfamily protein
MSWSNRHPERSHSTRRVTTPQPRANNYNQSVPAPQPRANNYNQPVRGTSSSIGWSSPSSATHGPSAAYPPQGGRSPQYGGLYRSDSGAHPTTFRQQGNTTPNVSQDECHAWFFAIDQDGDGTLSAEELRSALLNEGGLRFSASTVKYLMSIFDRDGNGVITFEEFEPLWVYMTDWRRMFDSFDGDRDGKIDAIELGRALDHYRIHVGRYVLDAIVKKYGMIPSRNRLPGYGNVQPRPQMDLDHFVCASVVVREMCELYEKCSAGGRSQLTRDEFLLAVISLP